ncbi:MAG: thiamine-phosphate kinase [Deltaproteobacteria bacterium]|nr:thiamine-phosphate kinase [Deltaproteobacteria bacterium]
MRTLGEIGEEALIRLFAQPERPIPPEVIVPNGDDAAVVRPRPGRSTVVTTDGLVEDIHFRLATADPRRLGRKLMSVNLSDLAAMGADPRYALLALCFPVATPVAVAEGIASGIYDRAGEYEVAIIGGNVSRIHGPIVLQATLIGDVEEANVLHRRGAVPGDALFVTGRLGRARLGLFLAQDPEARGPHEETMRAALEDPEPRVAAGRALAASHLVHAACDVSDGLGRDLRRLLTPTGLGAIVEADSVPLDPGLAEIAQRLQLDPLDLALEGGEDYELLIAAPASFEGALIGCCAAVGTPLWRLGTVTADRRVLVRHPDGTLRAMTAGFDHFNRDPR